jgi:hypothetical protein
MLKIILDILQGVKYYGRVKQKAPTNALTLTGAEIRTAEAVQTFQSEYRAFGCESQGDSSHEMPQLPKRSEEVRKAPQRPSGPKPK